eukprot:CAMPEP_0183304604 /NCGR_PEP_ID=MMETSP0160_2-20130417/9639_1 /TAXON_ID=2839 ORGANISM="Odontella Sinensis, Strain Grunow 1884" /NCGR_SAMPLE_ID=MMETSP0160_2 /ASSEMBLY_ACC=CAM_ASM_000250 /LENGTH=108 /DNA_ID=CAMNT_0025467689 /DNA_START=156 /DNA_END=482 /DNA_ORIENTATION=+
MDPVSRAVRLLSTVHSAKKLGVRGAATAAFTPRHFPKFLGGTMLLSGLAGYVWMEVLTKRRFEREEAMYVAAWEAGRRMTRRLTSTASAAAETARSTTTTATAAIRGQ